MHKRILALAAVFCLVFSMGVSAQEFKQYSGIENTSSETQSYNEAIEVLTALELINRADDAAFNTSDSMTRGEFITILVRALGLNEGITSEAQSLPFTDVDSAASYAGSVLYAYKLGIISGGSDGKFNPDQSIKTEEALKMLITTLGYTARAERKGGYPGGYIQLAKEKKITDKLAVTAGEALDKGTAAQLILNTLDVNVMQLSAVTGTDEKFVEIDGETLLSENFRVTKSEGIVKATELSRLTGPTGLDTGRIEIGKTQYVTGDTGAWELLGYNVTCYSREADGVNELLFAAKNSKNTVLTVAAEDIEKSDSDFSKRKFVYQDENDKRRTQSISPYAYLIYNGKALTDFVKADLAPSAGEVTLIDNDRDGAADVILVKEYQNLVVGDISTTSMTVFDEDNSSKYLCFDPEGDKYDFCLTKNGKNIAFNAIKSGNVVSYAMSSNTTGKKFVYAEVSDSSLHGTVNGKYTEGSGSYFTVGEEDYRLAANFSGKYAYIALKDSGTFYLDIYGRIAAYKEDTLDNEMYGFLLSYKCGKKGLNTEHYFEIYTMNGEIDKIDTAERFYLDGQLIKLQDLAPGGGLSAPNAVEAVLKNNVDETGDIGTYVDKTNFNQVIRYRLNYEGKIDKIDTLTADSEDGSLTKDALRTDADGNSLNRYYLKPQGAFGLDRVDFLIDENTLVFVVPEIGKHGDANNFLVARAMDYLVNGTSYVAEAYDMSDAKICALLVQYGDATDYAVNQETAITLVEKIASAQNEDGDVVGKLYGINSGKTVTLLAENSTLLTGLKTGDIIRYSTNARGDINSVTKYVDKTTTPQEWREGSGSTRYYSRFKLVYGMLKEKNGDTIVIDASGAEHMYQIKSARIYLYDEQLDKIKTATAADLNDALVTNSPNTRVAVYTRAGDMRDIVIMKWK